MRALPIIAFGLSVAAAGAPARGQSMSSTEFVPPTAAEGRHFNSATHDVGPTDVRRDPPLYAGTAVYWTGVTAGIKDGAPMVDHHYYDGVVEGGGGVWLSPWGEGRFCLLGLSPKVAARFSSEKPLFVRAYGRPVVTERGLCLRDVFAVVGDRGWTTTVIEYGPGGNHSFSESDVALRQALHSHPEERLLTPLGYRLLLGAQVGKTNFDDSPLGVGWNAAAELSLRTSLRTELALMAGPHAYPEFGAPTSLQTAALFRYYAVGIGIGFGPLLDVPLRDDEELWIGGRYLPMIGDALGTWALSPVLGGGMDVSATPDGDVRFVLQLVLGVDGNIGSPKPR